MIKINLLPIEMRQKTEIAKQNFGLLIVMLGFFIIIAIILIILFAIKSTVNSQIEAKNIEIENINSSLNIYAETKNKITFIKDRVKEIDNLKNQNSNWSDVLQILAKNTPDTITLTGFIFDKNTNPQIKITGKSPSGTEVIKFQKNLENSKIFTNVVFDSSKKILENNTELFDFQISASYSPKTTKD